jgi:hypothetical protein
MKTMSNPDQEDFAFLDENEWRIVHNWRQQKAGRIKETGKPKPQYVVPLDRSDLKMLVVPDSKVRDLIIHDDRFQKWMDNKCP